MSEIIIVGVGALGSHVVQFLRNEEQDIKVIDFDRVERKNVMSQFHGKSSVGKNKTQAVAQSMNFLFGAKVQSVPHKLTEDNAAQLLKDADLIIDCVDNIEARSLISLVGSEFDVPVLHGAVAANGEFGRVVWDEKFKADGGGEGEPTCEDGEHLPFLAITAAYIARAAQVFLRSEDSKKISFQVTPIGAQSI